ncbi:MAG: D-2-hydroxyacid dehydrogenase family protein [Deltaproteobacteria bacterium]|nr:D-2-hydroxyacid dehydrogenase family protein [Deltaproteobacteria bacterium]
MESGPGKKIRAAILDDYQNAVSGLNCLKRLEDRCEVLFCNHRGRSDEEIIRGLSGVEIIIPIHDRTDFHSHLLKALPGLKFISQTGARVYSIDMEAATRCGILVAISVSSGTPTVEQTFNLIFAVMRHTPQEDRAVREGKWQTTIGRELSGKTIGVLGLGRIGKEVARIAKAFHMSVLAAGLTLTPERAQAGGAEWVSVDDLLRRSDIVTIHWKLAERTRGLIGRRELELMKPSAVLINSSRGAIVDEAALIEALKAGKISGAGLDVYAEEPVNPRNPLLQLDNVVLAPHLGFVSVENYERSFSGAIDNILSYLDGNPINVVNPEAAQSRTA